jgi:hypothetical protein
MADNTLDTPVTDYKKVKMVDTVTKAYPGSREIAKGPKPTINSPRDSKKSK